MSKFNSDYLYNFAVVADLYISYNSAVGALIYIAATTVELYTLHYCTRASLAALLITVSLNVSFD